MHQFSKCLNNTLIAVFYTDMLLQHSLSLERWIVLRTCLFFFLNLLTNSIKGKTEQLCYVSFFVWIIYYRAMHSLSLSLSLSHTHTHTHARTHARMHACTHTLMLMWKVGVGGSPNVKQIEAYVHEYTMCAEEVPDNFDHYSRLHNKHTNKIWGTTTFGEGENVWSMRFFTHRPSMCTGFCSKCRSHYV